MGKGLIAQIIGAFTSPLGLIGASALVLLVVLSSYAATYRAGERAATAACDVRIQAAEIAALTRAAEATRHQRARAEALETANRTLQEKADEILAESRNTCPLDDSTRSRVLSIRP